jgi:hypothetical protein
MAALSSTGYARGSGFASIFRYSGRNLASLGLAASSASAALTRYRPAGGVTDFGWAPPGAPDPAMLGVTVTGGHTAYSTASNVAANSPYTEVTFPEEYRRPDGQILWKRGDYAAIVAEFDYVPNGYVVSGTNFSLRPYSATDPGNVIHVEPDRFNFVPDSGFNDQGVVAATTSLGFGYSASTGGGSSNVATATTYAKSSTFGLRYTQVTTTSIGTDYVPLTEGVKITGLLPHAGQWNILSAWVRHVSNVPTAGVYIEVSVTPVGGTAVVTRGSSTAKPDDTYVAADGTIWNRISVPFFVPNGDYSSGTAVFATIGLRHITLTAGVMPVFDVDEILGERGVTLRPYFGLDKNADPDGSGALASDYFRAASTSTYCAYLEHRTETISNLSRNISQELPWFSTASFTYVGYPSDIINATPVTGTFVL